MLYYDRRLPPDLLALVLPGGPLAWLVAYVRSHDNSRIEFRANRNGPGESCLQLYSGRGSLAKICWRAGGKVAVLADDAYHRLTTGVFGSAHDPSGLESMLRSYLAECADSMGSAFSAGEGAIQNALMRRYGLFYRMGDPFLAVDSEVRVGFDGDGTYAKGTEHRSAFTRELQEQLGDPSQRGRNKLDTLGILPTGELAVIEIKDQKGDIRRAAQQLAANLYTLGTLRKQDPPAFTTAIHGLIDQKIACRLIPASLPIPRLTSPEMVAIIAAPDEDPHWKSTWQRQVGDVLKNVPGVKYRVRFWRLSPTGEVADEDRH